MEKILYEKEICDYLNLPSLPAKEWDGKSPFNKGVAVVNMAYGEKAYAVASYDQQVDKEPRITKVFANGVFFDIVKVLIVPDYMETDVTDADLDEESKRKAEELAHEAEEIENENVVDTKNEDNLPEWIFDEIHSKEEAEAWLKAYNARNKIRGKIPTNEETIKLRLLAIHAELKNLNK